MNLTFFLTVLLVSHPTQVLATQADVALNETPLAEQLAEATRKVAIFRATWPVIARGSSPNEKLMTLESVVTELELDVLGKEALWRGLQQTSPEGMPKTADLAAKLATDPQIIALAEDLKSTEARLRDARTVGVANPNTVEQLEREYELARTRLDEQTAVKTLTYNNQVISQARQSFLRAQEMHCKANDQLTRVKAEQRVMDSRMAEYLRLLENRDTLRLRVEEEGAAAELAELRGMNLFELMGAVKRTQAALDQAQRIHHQTVTALMESVERSNLQGATEVNAQPNSRPTGN